MTEGLRQLFFSCITLQIERLLDQLRTWATLTSSSAATTRERERERESAFICGYANGTWVATAAPAVSTSSTAAPGEIAHPPLAKKKKREKKEAKQHYSRVGEKGETRDTDIHTESQTEREGDRPLLLIAARGREDEETATATTVFRISSSTGRGAGAGAGRVTRRR